MATVTSNIAENRVKDPTAEKIREYFINFLEKFQENEPSPGTGVEHYPTNPSSQTLQSDGRPRATPDNLFSSNFLSSEGFGQTQLTTTTITTNAIQVASQRIPYYKMQIIGMKHDGLNTLFVDFSHVHEFNEVLSTAIAENYYRFEPYLRKAVAAFVQSYLPEYAFINNSRQRREFWVAFYNMPIVNKLRELTTSRIGQLLSISGTVTRTSEVRPELYLGTFQCNDCRAVVKNVEQQFKYTEPSICQNPICGNRSNWTLLMDQSVFLDWQKVRIQENSHEIPPGCMPRSLDIIVRNDLVERARAGDKCDFTGCLIVVPDISQLALPGGKLEGRPQEGRGKEGFSTGTITGLKSLGVRELSYKLSFMSCMVTSTEGRRGKNHGANIRPDIDMDDTGANVEASLTLDEKEEILAIKNTPNLYNRLVESVAPSIFGHQDVKAGLLLMLFGGIQKVTSEGINLRGDINICIVGDPGTAKSQFLKYVTDFLPRSVYTSGKSSSAAGLTASVVKDEETGEFTIEAGALMLADNGICAIDEFDKMDLADQVAIHEAMEQQTISIAKAGIHATLNARTSILAAANPIQGRYDTRKSLRQNIAMTAPIMSRFDLFFVILDDCNESSDYNIARHILSIHRFKDDALEPEFSANQLQRYIQYARRLKPQFTAEAAALLVDKYVLLRQNDSSGGNLGGSGSGGNSYRMTVRQLESMIRLSEALARLHLDLEITPKYIREAYRLLKSSIIRVESDNVDLNCTELTNDLVMSGQAEVISTQQTSLSNSSSVISPSAMTIKYDAYVRISNMLVYQLRRGAVASDSTSDVALLDEDHIGMRKQALIDWYLEQIEAELETEADYVDNKKRVSAVIERLIHKDCVLIELKEALSTSEDPLLVVHPNYQP